MPSSRCQKTILLSVAVLVCMVVPFILARTTQGPVKIAARRYRHWVSSTVAQATKASPSSAESTHLKSGNVQKRNHGLQGHPSSLSARMSTFASSSSATDNKAVQYKYRVYVAVGSNLGDRFANIRQALELLCRDPAVAAATTLVRTSFLHETAPMYVTDQPAFLNGVVEVYTNLEPEQLLRSIKAIEKKLGRDLASNVPRNGPRPVDLDILSYELLSTNTSSNREMLVINTPELIVPHPRIAERDFVLIPLMDVAGGQLTLPGINGSIANALDRLCHTQCNSTKATSSSSSSSSPTTVRVLPLPRGRLLYFNETIVMGILNVTPDSFSDGGQWNETVDAAVERALAMEQQGAGIIDIGGESTRPGAKEVAIEEELQRTIPIITGIRQKSDIPISIDTRHAVVARAAVEAGADIVNDVSGGCFDRAMFSTVASLGVPMILMHMRGTPETMQTMTDYDDVVSEVALTLLQQSHSAAAWAASGSTFLGIHRWMQIVDPGIGFAKNLGGNLLLLQNIARIRSLAQNLPLVIGTSRKGFLGTITGVTRAEDRDAATVASCVAALCLESGQRQNEPHHHHPLCSILRVHNVAECKQAVLVMDAIRNAR